MKKILLSTTAVVALGTLSTEAFAAEKIKLELGGFMRQYVGFSNSDEVAATANTIAARDTGIGQKANTEVYFSGSTTLDNGLSVSAKIELESNTAATTNVDQSFLTVSSDALGALSLGARPHAADDLAVRAPMAGNFDFGDLSEWVGSSTAGTAGTTASAMTANDVAGGWDNDTIKVVYISPSFSGVTVGASWGADDDLNTDNAPLVTNANTDVYTFGIAYAGDFDGVTVDASVNHGRVVNTHNQTAVGLSVGVAGFTVGGSYIDFDGNSAATGSSITTSADGKSWELGVGYETGPYSLSATYSNQEDKGTTATAGDDEDTSWELAATYDMGAGVALSATYFDVSYDAEGNTAAVDANGLIAGIEVGF